MNIVTKKKEIERNDWKRRKREIENNESKRERKEGEKEGKERIMVKGPKAERRWMRGNNERKLRRELLNIIRKANGEKKAEKSKKGMEKGEIGE